MKELEGAIVTKITATADPDDARGRGGPTTDVQLVIVGRFDLPSLFDVLREAGARMPFDVPLPALQAHRDTVVALMRERDALKKKLATTRTLVEQLLATVGATTPERSASNDT